MWVRQARERVVGVVGRRERRSYGEKRVVLPGAFHKCEPASEDSERGDVRDQNLSRYLRREL